MSESIYIPANATREEKYHSLLPQLKALLSGENDVVANLANTVAALRETFGFFWVGFYLVKDDQLVLGPFQGPVACTRIAFGKGVCGSAWKEKKTILVPDVDAFPGHIACSSLSRSEIVVPLLNEHGQVLGVLDVDSHELNDFHTADHLGLERVAQLIAGIIS
jgi:L-methionine (R)-S-oxide reductase